jgi:hypothetical protein
MLWKRFKVDTSVMNDVEVVGNFRASGGSGNDIQAALMDESNFENWKNGHQAQVEYSWRCERKVHVARHLFPLF